MSVDDGWVRPTPGWTCPECGFDFDACMPVDMPDTVRGFVRRYRAPLTRGLPGEDLGALLRFHPETGGWSALEYACHVRDGFMLSEHRIAKVLDRDRPSFRVANPDDAAAAVLPEGWDRIGIAGDFELSVSWMGRNVIHEGTHHLLDIARAVRAARGR